MHLENSLSLSFENPAAYFHQLFLLYSTFYNIWQLFFQLYIDGDVEKNENGFISSVLQRPFSLEGVTEIWPRSLCIEELLIILIY